MSSFKSRYILKISNNFFSALLGLININLSSRALGPDNLGLFDFSNANASFVLSFLSMGLGMAFFNWMSREKSEKALAGLIVYTGFAFVFFILQLSFTLICAYFGIQNQLWPGVSTNILYFGILFSEFTFLLQIADFWSDGQAHTVGSEWIKLLISVVRCVLISSLFFLDHLTLTNFYAVQIGALALNLLLIVPWLWRKSNFSLFLPDWRMHISTFWSHLKLFGGPLVIYAWVGGFHDYFDKWILQYAGGSIQQGYFGFGNRLAGNIFIFVSALTPLFTREITNAHHSQNQEYFVKLFERIRIPITLTAIISCFGAVYADLLSRSFGGSEFHGAAFTVGLLCLFPIHQAFGQLVGSIYFATGNTRTYARYGIAYLSVGMIVAYLLLAPKTGSFIIPGLNLGSVGLAIKMVGVQFFATNVSLHVACRIIKQPFKPWLIFQMEILGLPLLIAYVSLQISIILRDQAAFYLKTFATMGDSVQSYATTIMGGLIYLLFISVFVWLRPGIFALSRSDLQQLVLKPFKMIKYRL